MCGMQPAPSGAVCIVGEANWLMVNGNCKALITVL